MHKSLLKLVFNTILCASLMLGAATFTSCQDYDDDIKNLEGKVTALETAVNDLKTQINAGKWITNVTTNADGYTVALSDGTTLNIVNGTKGTTVEPNKTTGTWWIDGKDTGIAYECNVNMPKVENGELQLWNAETEAYEGTGIKANASYVVKQEGYWELHVADKDGKEQIVKLPMSGTISSMKVYWMNENNNTLYDQSTVTKFLQYGVKLDKDIEFNGKTYTKGNYLTHTNAWTLIQVNPTNVEFENYTVSLVDSKDQVSPVVLSKPYKHMTEKPYGTKAEEKTPNNGFYVIDFTLPADADLSYFENNGTIASPAIQYFVKAVEPASGNAVLADEPIKLNLSKGNTYKIDNITATLKTNKEHTLVGEITENLNMSNYPFVDYYFSMLEGQTATFEKYGVKFDQATQTISAEKPGQVELMFNYLDIDKNKAEGKGNNLKLTITFVAEEDATDIADYEWTIQQDIDNKDDKNALQVTNAIPESAFNYLSKLSTSTAASIPQDKDIATGETVQAGAKKLDGNVKLEYATDVTVNGDVVAKAEDPYTQSGIEFVVFSTKDAKGYMHYYMRAIFADPADLTNAKYHATTYNATLDTKEYGLNGETTTTTYEFKVVLKAASLEGIFKHNKAYFTGQNALVYADPAKTSTTDVKYDLKDLYENTDLGYIYFEEKVWVIGETEDGADVRAPYWLASKTVATSAEITVPLYKDDTEGIVLDEEGKDLVPAATEPIEDVNSGVSSSRTYVVTYLPFGNANFDLATEEITLTVKDKVYEAQSITVTAPAAVKKDEDKSAEFKYSHIVVKDIYGAQVKAPTTGTGYTDPEFTLELSDAAAEYIKITGTTAAADGKTATLAKDDKVVFELLSPATARQENVECVVTVTYVDQWNMEQTKDFKVVLEKNVVTPAAE